MTIEELFAVTKTIAVVGVSQDPSRSSYSVAMRMMRFGMTIIPVNPMLETWEGLKCYPSVSAIPEDISIDIVDVFRREEFLVEVISDTLSRNQRPICIWLQQGLRSSEGESLCNNTGVFYVDDACLAVDYNFYLSRNRS